MGSSLEFNIHRLRYIQLLAEQKPMEALIYGRELFAPFADKHLTGKQEKEDSTGVKSLNIHVCFSNRNQALDDLHDLLP